MDRRQFLSAAAVLAAATAPSMPALAEAAPATPSADPLNPPGIRTAGIRMIPVVGGKYKVWTKKVGSGATKVLLLHGGPGIGHEYLEAMEAFLPEAGIEMYYYDQLGVNNSDQPDDPALWTLTRYVDEVEEVRRGLGLDQFVLFGHSWGGMLGIEYALKYQQHLKGLVISNMTAGIQSYLKRTNSLRALLKPDSRKRLAELEAKKDYDSPDYDRIMMEELYPQIICRLDPWPEPVTRALRHANFAIYNQMQGKSEMEVTGNLKDWERWDALSRITVKTLTIGAAHDEMDPEDIKRMATLMPNARSVICPKGSHMCFWDDQDFYFKNLIPFLKSV
ncbi:proline-specific peptidase [Nitrospirillum viridazoti Y2]|uniref:Proline iminopeptidase n=1 Tax=Nitrospirillum amazonense TaxID=28077 RepID=A0A560HR13_9PROT|nr:proline iminopeptidase-family hydrolase [Nitrospirillum amazonense]EGY00434.1 proline-specific peptidase [Nitrospirillum amazonense Y2]TWB48845.1 proline iminopeptidase [Nitrospirillum amazonense]